MLVQVGLEAPVPALLQLPEPARLVPLLRAADLSTRLREQAENQGEKRSFCIGIGSYLYMFVKESAKKYT